MKNIEELRDAFKRNINPEVAAKEAAEREEWEKQCIPLMKEGEKLAEEYQICVDHNRHDETYRMDRLHRLLARLKHHPLYDGCTFFQIHSVYDHKGLLNVTMHFQPEEKDFERWRKFIKVVCDCWNDEYEDGYGSTTIQWNNGFICLDGFRSESIIYSWDDRKKWKLEDE